jgi:hypothetical protein
MYDNRHRKNTYASSTVATDGTAVYAYFESGGLHVFDFTDRVAGRLRRSSARHQRGR